MKPRGQYAPANLKRSLDMDGNASFIVAGVKSGMRMSDEEVFGPMARPCLDDEASAHAGAFCRGLAAPAYASDACHAWHMSQACLAGMAGINTAAMAA